MPQMWEKTGEAADKRIYGSDFKKELGRATFGHLLPVAGKWFGVLSNWVL